MLAFFSRKLKLSTSTLQFEKQYFNNMFFYSGDNNLDMWFQNIWYH